MIQGCSKVLPDARVKANTEWLTVYSIWSIQFVDNISNGMIIKNFLSQVTVVPRIILTLRWATHLLLTLLCRLISHWIGLMCRTYRNWGEDGVWLLWRIIKEMAPWISYFWRSQLPCHDDTQAAIWRDPYSRERPAVAKRHMAMPTVKCNLFLNQDDFSQLH